MQRPLVLPTVPGVVLISVALGIGSAAYNTGSNILFITISLLLSSLLLSGLLSWLNFCGLRWRISVVEPWRAGQNQQVMLELRNDKKMLPTYALAFDLKLVEQEDRETLFLPSRLESHGALKLEWMVRPVTRGLETVRLEQVSSMYPFGFLRKLIRPALEVSVLVWPATVSYRSFITEGWNQQTTGHYFNRMGQGGDFRSLREYVQGDSPRHIHWKATARLRHMVVREFSAESQEGYVLCLETSAELWPIPEQFELLISLVATLAEDLFRESRLAALSINGEFPRPVRQLRDVEDFLGRLALIEPDPKLPVEMALPTHRRNRLHFKPDGTKGVLAVINGNIAASA